MIPFTQYLLPNGRQVEIKIERPEEIEKLAQEIMDRGYVFEAEILTTDDVSLTIADKIAEVDVAIKISPNGENIPDAVDDLIRKFHKRMIDEDLRPGEEYDENEG